MSQVIAGKNLYRSAGVLLLVFAVMLNVPSPTVAGAYDSRDKSALHHAITVSAPQQHSTGNPLQLTNTDLSPAQALTYTAYFPIVAKPYTCPTTSSAPYEAISFLGPPYKNNAITDENADFRLSILGYVKTNQTLDYVSYGGGTGTGDGPQFADMFTPKRKPAFVAAYQVYLWRWNDGPGSAPPYGSRGGLNTNWVVTALDVGTTRGEPLNIPFRNAANAPPDYRALVLYAGPNELTVAYLLQDQVVVNASGYVVHMLGFCVDPNLLALYQAQLSGGKRSTMKLPAIRNSQAVGTALGDTLTIAVRDGGAYMDPRVKTDWWYDAP